MKILIFYASYGGGHLSAAKSIQSYINENYPENQTELIDCMKYVNKPIEKMTTAAYREMAKKAPWVWGKIYDKSQKGALAHISTRSNTIMAIKLLKLLRAEQPDLIISTHPFSSQMCSYLKRKGKVTAKLATIMTDFAPHDQWLVGKEYTDFFFVANDKMKEYLTKQNINEKNVFVTGIPLSSKFLKKFNKIEIFKLFNLNPLKQTILFFAGGEFGLGKSQTLDIFKCIVKNFNNIQMIAIAGKNEKMQEMFKEYVKKFNKEDSIKILPFTDKVPELMAISDLVITKPGGLTITESLASSLPIIVISPIPGQEEENAEYLEEKGIAVWIRKHDDAYTILQKILNDQEKLERMKKNTSLLANKNSTRDICEILLK
ncbi:MAG: glycosyltransferase [Clostridia bacterium]|nr:glycosyltransferase [Clostridia bacterium]